MLQILATRITPPYDQGCLDGSPYVDLTVVDGAGATLDRVRAVSGDRRARILADMADGEIDDVSPPRLCEVCRSVTAMTGAGIMLMSGDVARGSVCTTGEVSALIENLQYTLGDGPCVDAYRLDRPVLEPDLADPAEPRWQAFSGPALDAGVRAIFGFPITVGTVRLGALNLYADRPGSLSDDQHANALVMADIAGEAMLAISAKGADGILAGDLEEGTNFQYVVHQAAGMVSAQLDVSVAQALVRIRAYAFGNQRLLAEVAADVVARRLRFNDSDP